MSMISRIETSVKVLTIFLFSFNYLSCSAAPVKVKHITPQIQKLEDSYLTLAEINSFNSKSFYATHTGTVDKIYKSPGEWVDKGGNILSIDEELYRALKESAKGEYNFIKNNLQRERTLLKKGLSSEEKVENLKRQLEKAEYEFQKVLKDYENSIITAPFSGYLGDIYTLQNSQVSAGEKLFTISDNNKFIADLELPLKHTRRLDREKLRVQLLSDNEANNKNLYISSISERVLNENGNVTLRAEIDTNSETKTNNIHPRHGEMANFKIVLNSYEGLVVPENAIVTEGSKSYVYKLENGKAGKVYVTPGLRKDGWRAVTPQSKKLSKKSIVISEGINKLDDGYKVELIE